MTALIETLLSPEGLIYSGGCTQYTRGMMVVLAMAVASTGAPTHAGPISAKWASFDCSFNIELAMLGGILSTVTFYISYVPIDTGIPFR